MSAVLVAHEPPGTEHLGIRLVAAASVEAGFRPRVLPLLTPVALANAVAQTLAERPFLVGVSLSDPLVAPLMLAFDQPQCPLWPRPAALMVEGVDLSRGKSTPVDADVVDLAGERIPIAPS